MEIVKSVDDRVLLAFGMGVLMLILWFFKWLIQRSLNAQFDKMAAANMADRKERETDLYLSLRGQQVTNDCLHELIYAVINGTHNGGLVQPRWRSWAVWVSVLGAAWTICNALGLTQKWGIEETTFKTVVDALGVILIGFGILNNPTDKEHF